MTLTVWEDLSLLNLLPPLRRTRGDRFYDRSGKHWVDLWKDNGAWLYGHRPDSLAHEWKNQFDKGMTALVPSGYEKPLQKHMSELFPSLQHMVVLRNPERASALFQNLFGHNLRFSDWEAMIWRPFVENTKSFPNGVVWPLLPWGPAQARVLVFAGDFGDQEALKNLHSDLVSPAELMCLIRAVLMVRNSLKDPIEGEKRKRGWAAFDESQKGLDLFSRNGPYLMANVIPERYEVLFRVFWENGFVLSPDQSFPSTLPLEMSFGELKAFQRASQTFANQEAAWIS